MEKPPCDYSRQSPNKNGYAGKRKVEGIVWHVTVGSAQSSLGWLCNPVSNASCNYLIDRQGKIYELVSPDEDAWANGAVNMPEMSNPLIRDWVTSGRNPNTRTISIENERTQSSNNQSGGFTEAQQNALVDLTAWCCQQYAVVPDRTHIFGHRSLDSVNRKFCPGISEEEWDSWVGEVAAMVGGSAPAGNQTVPVPPRGTAVTTLTSDGQPVTVIAWDGQAVTVNGSDFVDLGIVVTNGQGERYARSLQGNAMQPWHKIA